MLSSKRLLLKALAQAHLSRASIPQPILNEQINEINQKEVNTVFNCTFVYNINKKVHFK